MPLYNITHEFETDGGNIQYNTIQKVEKEAETSGIDCAIVTTGLALEDDTITGIAVVELDDSIEPASVFESATTIQRRAERSDSEAGNSQASATEPSDPDPVHDIQRFETDADVAESLEAVGQTPGHGVLFNANLTRCHPFDRDRWFVPIGGTGLTDTAVTPADVVSFYRTHLDLLSEQQSLKIAVYHRASDSTIQLALVAPLTEEDAATELAEKEKTGRPMNFYRFELSKVSLVVGEMTHGPGTIDAVFRSDSEDQATSRELIYRRWFEGVPVSYHPLGVMVDGDLYRPVLSDGDDISWSAVGDPIPIETYRGSPKSRPWQYGVTRSDDQLFITQARASPEKFDPVLKRYPIETKTIDDEPLVFNHTVSRRVWSEDPQNMRIQSQRSEGLLTQFLYADSDGWHLIQPKTLTDTVEATESSFEPTQLDGVSARSSLLRAETDGETKSTVEHEYQVAPHALDSCDSLYALSNYEVNEESVDNLEWQIADATAYELVRENAPLH